MPVPSRAHRRGEARSNLEIPVNMWFAGIQETIRCSSPRPGLKKLRHGKQILPALEKEIVLPRRQIAGSNLHRTFCADS
jgi:hypothetical protein